jgi:predicted Zn-dependent protease
MKRVISIVMITAVLAACQPRPPYEPPRKPQPVPRTQQPPPETTPTPAEPPPPAQPPPTAPPTKSYQLGPASAALVAQAQSQAGGGNGALAVGTLERALRIEPDNPLLWIELGKVHQDLGHSSQADSMGRKALTLASGDPRTQAAAWRLIADSLRARNRNPEAAEADRKADTLAAR